MPLAASRSEFVVDPRWATVHAKVKPLERACREQPLVQIRPAHAERIRDVLMRTSSVTVKRDDEALNPDARHRHAFIVIEP
jgi:hypothetical protein